MLVAGESVMVQVASPLFLTVAVGIQGIAAVGRRRFHLAERHGAAVFDRQGLDHYAQLRPEVMACTRAELK